LQRPQQLTERRRNGGDGIGLRPRFRAHNAQHVLALHRGSALARKPRMYGHFRTGVENAQLFVHQSVTVSPISRHGTL
jgi:hypothetical protein